MAAKFFVVGIGPGHSDYILPKAVRTIESSDYLIGGLRHLEIFSAMGKPSLELKGNYSAALDYAEYHYRDKAISILVSGDPGFYSLLGMVSRRFRPDEYKVIPGISSFQIAFARLGIPWQRARLCSFHGRKFSEKGNDLLKPGPACVLTDHKSTASEIARFLTENGQGARRFISAENLSYSDERIIKTTAGEYSETEGADLCVVILL